MVVVVDRFFSNLSKLQWTLEDLDFKGSEFLYCRSLLSVAVSGIPVINFSLAN